MTKTKNLILQIAEILHPNYAEKIEKGIAYLTEDKEPNYPKTKISGSGKWYLYKFDKEQKHKSGIGIELLPFFKAGEAKQMCDYIAFYSNDKQEAFAIICNLKSKQQGNNKKQIIAATDFIKYIEAVAQRCGGIKHELKIITLSFSLNSKTYRDDDYTYKQKQLKIAPLKAGEPIDLTDYCH